MKNYRINTYLGRQLSKMSIEKLTSTNLILRELKSKDLLSYFDLLADSETMTFFGGPTVNNVLDLNNVITKKLTEFKLNQSHFWVITEVEEREFVGFIRIMNYESFYFDASYESMGSLKDSAPFNQFINRKGWEVEYALLPEFRNRGIMNECLNLVLKYCKEKSFTPIYAKVNSMSNKPSINVLIKNKFREYLQMQNQLGTLGMLYKLE